MIYGDEHFPVQEQSLRLIPYYQDGQRKAVKIELGATANLFGRVDYSGVEAVATVTAFDVAHQQRGMGRRLLGAFFSYADGSGADIFHARIIHPAALALVGKFFEEDVISIADEVNGEMVELPASIAQACQSSERAREAADNYLGDFPGPNSSLFVTADMTGLITTHLEQPIIDVGGSL